MNLRNISSVGVEVECGMPYPLYSAIYRYIEGDEDFDSEGYDLLRKFERVNISIDTDGSVDVPRPLGFEDFWKNNAEVRYWSRNPDKVLRFVKMLFDNGIKQNKTCGNHVHVRADKRFISAIACVEAVQDFVRRYEMRWSLSEKHIRRCYGRYSHTEYATDRRKFIKEFLRDRYVALNFISLFELQRTLEIRILPYADSYEEYEVQFKWLLETIDDMIDEWSEKFKVSLGINVAKIVKVSEERIEEVIE